MSYGHYIKELGRGAEGSRDLTLEDARQLYAAMLDGGVPDLELGAILIALRVKGEATEEMLGFMQAIDAHLHRFDNPQGRARPVILPGSFLVWHFWLGPVFTLSAIFASRPNR